MPSGATGAESVSRPKVGIWFRASGLLPVAFYLIHPFRVYILGDSPTGALWFCHVGNLVLAAGMMTASARVVGVSTCWLLLGGGIWAVDLAAGGTLIPTSLFVHLGGAAVAVLASYKLGFPKGTWILAAASMIALQLITRLVSTAELNVNLAFRVWTGWEKTFHSYPLYMAMMYGITLAAFLGIELFFQKIGSK